jgi:hypothetical protein
MSEVRIEVDHWAADVAVTVRSETIDEPLHVTLTRAVERVQEAIHGLS